MKRIIGYTLAILISYNLSAQEQIEKSPLNQEFIDYINMIKTPGFKKSTEGHGTGYMPPFMYLHFNSVDSKRDNKKNALVALPAKFDQRDSGWITSVKDQGPLGACWSFSTMGALETRFIRLGKATISIDLSEQNMATCHGFQASINDGGSDFIASAYLSRLSGPVTEASDPYVPTNPNAVCGPGPFDIPAYSPRIVWLPNDLYIIKKAIRDYGAVTSSIRINNYTQYYNPADFTFYYNGTAAVDHGVLIVGWDDNKIVTGGTLSPKGTTGVWIVKKQLGNSIRTKWFLLCFL
jgi:C1A family cysteine protease